MDNTVFLFIVECGLCCGCGGQFKSCIVCHKVYTAEWILDVSEALRHSGENDYV